MSSTVFFVIHACPYPHPLTIETDGSDEFELPIKHPDKESVEKVAQALFERSNGDMLQPRRAGVEYALA